MKDNYRTLHKDIGLVQRSNQGFDLWFENGDIVKAEDFHSLQVGIILACLTSWNYLNRYGNPTYEIFGNRAYELLKSNKNSMVQYKIQQYFIECLKRMRRVYEIVYLEVKEIPNEPYKYFVEFEVLSITNQLVDGSFTISTEQTKATSYINYNVYMSYASDTNPLQIDLWLKNEFGGGLEGEILYMYLKKGDGEYEYKVIGKTDSTGYIRVEYEPTESNQENVIYFDFHGNTTYNPCSSERTVFTTELFDYQLDFTKYEETTEEPIQKIQLKLIEHSQLTDIYKAKNEALISITRQDGKEYFALTNKDGEVEINIDLEEGTNTFIATYNDISKSIDIEKI